MTSGRKRQAVVLVAAAAAFCASSAWSADVETVKIGGEVKKTVGVVTDIQQGDVACYFDLKDDNGVAFNEMAEFDLCLPKAMKALKGRKVRLTYKIESVLADECQGNPACPKTKKTPVIHSAKVVKAARGEKD